MTSKSPLPRPYTRGYNHEPENWAVLDHIDWQHYVVVEVGCGAGDWICKEAEAHPNQHYIGIESTQARSQQFFKNAHRVELSNLTPIRADAILLLDAKCPPESVDEFYFFFPNPWPKSRQANKRFFSGSAIHVFDRCLKSGGSMLIASNSESYTQEAADNLAHLGYKISINSTPSQPRTGFEQKYLARGEKIFQITAVKQN
ncbi:MAG: hypothetical protein COV45_00230 [Deltaproteobacteria bacterium CG11_big_fil_rev_8_21_14_0_20_47_16]|nr:MAG: hypothetical protein COV45_00230 [Deltaproteobacteria bacterium CG11_big_fil_rev_8_21_14_0_20_47_16]